VLHLIDVALEAWLRATVPLGAQEVDVSFAAPEKEWSAKLTRPTVNVFLWDVRRSNRDERSGVEEIERDGRRVRRQAPPRVDLRYVITAWTTDHGDERAILGGLLRTVLAHPDVPSTFVPEPIQDLPPMRVLLSRSGDSAPDFGTTVDGQLRVGLAITVIAAIDVDVYAPAGPPVSTVALGTTRMDTGSHGTFPVRWVAGELEDPNAIGAVVVSPRGTARINTAGRFVVAAAAGDELVVETTPPRTTVVPVEGGVRI
jgi:Pvc16 N-terminal domain